MTGSLVTTHREGAAKVSKTPRHDELVLWVDQNVEELVAGFAKSDWSDRDKDNWRHVHPSEPLPDFPRPRLVGKVWEKPVAAPNGRYAHKIVGYIDLQATVAEPAIFLRHVSSYREAASAQIGWERGIISFEVKPGIESLGELMRQLRTYEFFAPGRYVVVSWDGRLAAIIREQGFGFVLAGGGTSGLFNA